MIRPNLQNSIYQQSGSGFGLTVKDGMLINNRPDGVTGIKQAADLKKEMKRQEKIDMVAQGYVRGEQLCKLQERILRF